MKKNRDRQHLWYSSVPNFLLKMKLLSFLIFVSIATVTANSYSQQTKFNMNFENVAVRQVFQQIEDNSEFILLYSEKSVDLERKVNIDVNNQTVDKILDQVFDGTDNYYEIHDRQIAIMEKGSTEKPLIVLNPSEADQKKSILGKVRDSFGSSLPGVSVVVKGTTTGTITDNEGNFSLSNVPENAILQFSFIGMKSQEVSMIGKTNITVSMEETTVGIDEVVAVGYGTMKKSSLTGAVASVKSDQLTTRPVTDIGQALAGQVAGVDVGSVTSPGSTPNIVIRGYRSINNNKPPLYVVDGIPREDYNDIPVHTK